MDANRLIRPARWVIALGFFGLSVFASAQDTKLTPDQYIRMCAFAGTCDEAAGKSDAGQSAGAPSEVLDISDTNEQPFEIFHAGGARRAPSQTAAQFVPSATRNVSGPKLFPVGQHPLAETKRSRNIHPRHPNADDMRVQFANGSAELGAGDFSELDFWSRGLQSPKFAQLRIRIEGHTNAVGNRDFNLALSQRRAKAVADYLVAHGISQDRIEAKGYGFDVPRIISAPGDARNRRVEIIKVN